MKRIGAVVVLVATGFGLAGCSLFQDTGPCYGFGCHAGLLTPKAQSAKVAPAGGSSAGNSQQPSGQRGN